MDAQSILEHLEEAYETELSRLGSSKAMYAVTEGEMDSASVLQAMADRAIAAARTFEEWAAESADPMADRYGEVATAVREHADRIAARGDGIDPTDQPTPLEEFLRDLDTPGERFAGFVTWAEVTDRTYSQAVAFYVGNANPQLANLFRDIRSELAEHLDAVESGPADGEVGPGKAVAEKAVEAAYQHYVETLERMGIKVKPVC